MAVDELLIRWEELEKKKKDVNESLAELRRDMGSFFRDYSGECRN